MDASDDPIALLEDVREIFLESQNQDADTITTTVERMKEAQMKVVQKELDVKSLIESIQNNVLKLERDNGVGAEQKQKELESEEESTKHEIESMSTKVEEMKLTLQKETSELQRLNECKEKAAAESDETYKSNRRMSNMKINELNLFKTFANVEFFSDDGYKGSVGLQKKKQIRCFKLSGRNNFDDVNHLWNLMWEDHS
mmetsp:Transcript_35535/g.69019  ORF Transcript_35535/g.69019 Transcript_35535/m.69019 type:complete len:199 (-) Transcript_35535:31-627(-)